MIETQTQQVSIYTEMTPNPESMKFVVNKLIYEGKTFDAQNIQDAQASPLAVELFTFPFIKSVFIASNFITLNKISETNWNDVIPAITSFLTAYLEENKPIVIEEKLANQFSDSAENESEIVKKITSILDDYIRPAVEMDGGAIQFKGYNDGVVSVALQGSCSGCPSSMITLKSGIEGMLKRMIPEVTEVVAVQE